MQQKADGKVHIIQFSSRTMISAEQNYRAREREALAIIFFLQKFRVYLFSTQPFVLRSGQKEFSYDLQKRDIHGRPARGLEILAEYDFTVEYKTGKFN